MISVNNLKKSFGKLEVLKGITCDIEKGDKVAIIGPSGSGKSTFLRCLNLLEVPTAGEVWLDGKLISALDETLHPDLVGNKQKKKAFIAKYRWALDDARKHMGMVFQHFNLFNNLTILNNITLAPILAAKAERKVAKKLNALKNKYDQLTADGENVKAEKLLKLNAQASKIYGQQMELESYEIKPILSDKEIQTNAENKAHALLERIGLSDKASVYPSTLSGGQKQRVAIIRALAMDPEVLLFDEPTSALDIEMVKEVLTLIKELADDGMTMLIVTHELKFARDVASKIIFMDDGKILESDTPENIFNHPQTDRLKNFLAQVAD